MPTYIYAPFTGNLGGIGTISATGPILLGNGSAAAPSYSFSSASTSGLYLSGGNLSLGYGGALYYTFGSGGPSLVGQALTSGTMNQNVTPTIIKSISRFDWTNAMVVALGAVLSGNISVCTLPAKAVVTNAYLVIGTAAAGTTTLTVSVGRTAAAYIDYLTAQDAKAAANTVYGDAAGERGTNLTGYDLPSFTATTTVYAQFVATGANLNSVTTSTGSIYLETMILP